MQGSAVKDGHGRTVAAVVAVSDIEGRKRDDEQRTLLNHELAHRLKNTLAVVQSIATQTLRGAPDLVAPRAPASASASAPCRRRTTSCWPGGATPARSRPSCAPRSRRTIPTSASVLNGPAVMIGPKASLSLALIGHELATNAVKYGALSVPGGSVEARWSVGESADGSSVLHLDWREVGGPAVAPPVQKGSARG